MNPAVAPLPKPPTPPLPGLPPIPPIAPVRLGRVALSAPEAPARPAVQRMPRPAPAAPRQPSLFRRALAALVPRPRGTVATPDFGVPPDTYVGTAPKSGVALARMTLGTRPVPALPVPRVEPTVAPEPELRRPYERTLAPGVSAPLATPEETTPAPPPPAPAAPTQGATPAGDPDAAYRDLLHRVREEREQLGQLITHPF